ncbi:MAG: PIN domain-containing protein [Akkermansiaceae bacterium]|jgi:predicted nucleic acid-binding protein|nr:PIN domain-containing protein [Akkermansiaceae bacterium]
MIALVDTSVWIDFLRQPAGSVPELELALREGRAALCPVVWVELWSGARGKAEEAILLEMRALCLPLEMDAATWQRAAELNRAAARNGVSCPLADVLIVACAMCHGTILLHRDKHIDTLLALAAPPGAEGGSQ